jgi:hypothetical protein
MIVTGARVRGQHTSWPGSIYICPAINPTAREDINHATISNLESTAPPPRYHGLDTSPAFDHHEGDSQPVRRRWRPRRTPCPAGGPSAPAAPSASARWEEMTTTDTAVRTRMRMVMVRMIIMVTTMMIMTMVMMKAGGSHGGFYYPDDDEDQGLT